MGGGGHGLVPHRATVGDRCPWGTGNPDPAAGSHFADDAGTLMGVDLVRGRGSVPECP